MRFPSIIIYIGLSILLFGCFDRHPKGDLVLFNANIYTVNEEEPKAEALAVVNGKIVYVGNNVNANNWVADTTQVIDLEGKTVIPGFIEGHGHIMGLGYSKVNLDLSNAQDFDEILNLVQERLTKLDKGEWLYGTGWHQEKWTSFTDSLIQGFPTNKLLNGISKDNPVVLIHASGHAYLVNDKVLGLSGIRNNPTFRDDKDIIFDLEGVPTGIVRESSMKIINEVKPDLSDDLQIEALNLAIEDCLKNGVTSFQDAGSSQKTINLIHSFVKNDLLRIRFYLMVDGRTDDELVQNWLTHGPSIGLNNDFLSIRSIKLVADGALGSRGALLKNEYSDAPDNKGHRLQSLDYIMRISEKAYKKGFQVNTHCIGDQANKDVLDIYEIVLNTDTTKANPRFRIEHAQHLRPEDISRFGELGVIPSVQAIHLSSDRPWAIDRLGKERIESGSYAWKSLINSGAVLMNGTDTPVEPISPIANFYASVTRKTLIGGPSGGYEPNEKMSREEALKSMTINAAYGSFEESIKGSIQLGKYADFTILSQDIMKVPEDEILSTEVLYTIVNGEIEYKK